MRNRSAGLLLVLGLGMGCARPEVGPSAEGSSASRNQPVEKVLALGKQAQAHELTLTLTQVTDSRCPKNVMCIRYGSAVAEVTVQDSRGNSAKQQLYLGEALAEPNNRGFRSADSVDVALGSKKYLLVLQEVQPYPLDSEEAQPPKTAKVTVRPL
ncbi:MAG: hypothetical protein ACO1OQ_04650 [Rufibacter sp.]